MKRAIVLLTLTFSLFFVLSVMLGACTNAGGTPTTKPRPTETTGDTTGDTTADTTDATTEATTETTTEATTEATTEPTTKPTTQPTTPATKPLERPADEPTDAATEPTEETLPDNLSPAEIEAAAAVLVKKTDFIAAGYDYDKAISMLRQFKYYSSVPSFGDKIAEYEAGKATLKKYNKMSTITHIFFHSLIVDTDRAFGKGSYQPGGYNQWMTTVDEFKFLLESMYQRGYVLITPYQMVGEETDSSGNTKFQYRDIYLPEGKIPFIMSQDDLNYYGYMIADKSGSGSTPQFASKKGDGFAHKIIIGEDGKPTCEYMDASGEIHVGDYDLVPILESFIQEHPDFAYRGARAVLGVTGYEGVFGYRTKPSYEATLGADRYAKEVADAKAVAQCLKENGWIIASHSYGHPAYGNISAERVDSDSGKWEDTVQPIVGRTDILLYPHGNDIAGVGKYTFSNEKFATLYNDGYRYFYNVDSNDYWNQLGTNYFRGGRRNVDGYRMWYSPKKLDDLMGTKVIQYYDKDGELVERTVSEAFDDARPRPVPQL